MYKSACAVLFALLASATAFNVVVPAPRPTEVRASSTTLSSGYVPDGLTEKEYKDLQKKQEQQKAANKKYFKNKKFESIDSFMKGMEQNGRGHTFAKVDDSKQAQKPGASRFLEK